MTPERLHVILDELKAEHNRLSNQMPMPENYLFMKDSLVKARMYLRSYAKHLDVEGGG